MKVFPEGIQFTYSWRSYQQKVLDQLHIDGLHKYHLVAPPGSGKTVLGLEMMVRLNQPTFILAPTIAIRNQWAERFRELFLQFNQLPHWVSTDIRNPQFVTISTYQGLHQFMKNQQVEESEADDLDTEPLALDEFSEEKAKETLLSLPFGTLILDEAHHLRTAWWRTTMEFKKQLKNPSVISLTATPPYDVSVNEWNRYEQLCGTIDDEISVAELVKANELCPHQDFVYFSEPTNVEKEKIKTFRQGVESLIHTVKNNQPFITLIEEHPWISDHKNHLEDILSNHAAFSSLLIFLKAVNSEAWKTPLIVTGMKEKQVPKITTDWWEEFFQFILYTDTFYEGKSEPIQTLRRGLSKAGAIERRKVTLVSNNQIKRSLVQSSSKLQSMTNIVQFEKKQLKQALRMVVLTDFIRPEHLPKRNEDVKDFTQIGVIPIFETLRRRFQLEIKLAVLTGSVVIVPETSIRALKSISEGYDISLTFTKLHYTNDYYQIAVNTAARQKIVQIMTEAFMAGEFEVMIGTAALLGEGWDAPCINSLILASYVGSFMLSNQMRGRAIRIEKNNVEKTSNIWHLACLDYDDPTGGEDYILLTRRFKALIGLSHKEDVIETGIFRMDIQEPPFYSFSPTTTNRNTIEIAEQREQLKTRWLRSIDNGSQLTEELKAKKDKLPGPVVFSQTLKAIIFVGFTLFALSSSEIIRRATELGVRALPQFFTVLLVALIIGFIVASPYIWKAMKIHWKNNSLENRMNHVSEAIYASLEKSELLSTPLQQQRFEIVEVSAGEFTIWPVAGSTYEKTMFLQSLQDFIDPIENPRYLLVRKTKEKYRVKTDYHALPQELGRNKETAELFLRQWQKRLGSAELIYTRTIEGRQILLQARVKAMSQQFIEKSERLSAWR